MKKLILIFLIGFAFTAQASVSENGLVGHWSLNEGRGTTASDHSGNGYTGTLTSSPTWVQGWLNNAIKTDGSSSYVNIGNPAKLQFTASQAFSFSVWVKQTTSAGASTYNGIFGDNDGVTDGWGLFQVNGFGVCTHCFEYCYFPGTYYACNDSDNNTEIAGKWQHIVITNDTSNLHTGRKMYLNGVLQTGSRVDGAIGGDGLPDINYTNNTLTIGDRHGAGAYWGGSTDEVKVWNRELTQAEVLQLYKQGLTVYKNIPDHLTLFTKLTNWLTHFK